MLNPTSIRARIEEVAATEAELSPTDARDVAFHLTDWLDDLSAYVDFCQNPGSRTSEEINAVLLAFLQHAPNHIAAAAKLYADFPVTDIFGVGAVVASTDADA